MCGAAWCWCVDRKADSGATRPDKPGFDRRSGRGGAWRGSSASWTAAKNSSVPVAVWKAAPSGHRAHAIAAKADAITAIGLSGNDLEDDVTALLVADGLDLVARGRELRQAAA